MGREQAEVGIARGSGLVARFEDIVVFIPRETPFTERILEAAEVAAEADDPGATFVRQLVAAVFVEGAAAAAAFGVVAPTAGGVLVLLRGPVVALIDKFDETQRLSGTRAMTWLDEVVREPVQQVVLAEDDDLPVEELPHTDLRAGVAPGGGVIVRALVDGSTTTGQHRAVGESSTPAAALLAAQLPVPVDHRGWSAVGVQTAAALSNPHADTVTYHTPHGVLVGNDGAAYPLDRPYVIGRDPMAADVVRHAAASPIAFADQGMSRVHALVSVDNGTVFVHDNETPTGTFIAAPGAEQWTRLGPRPEALQPGWSLRVGNTVLTYRATN
ncbi:FHA domain-containing protein [Nocardia sp. CDC159]|uniref:FHA domain-containing protein n=1 Tax=Nocardia pulmonis TaxID=2951408 RepID=A0A9X2EB76_9NOCA|nr:MULTISPECIES: FHA domain-containing protein [Nocardia]MCM6777719.1 FHA domain-containing protein [Nocardia pulmonis]MCM6790477.1 FHA domain-containing protein [Nocardia sp. CDC159]